MQNFKVFFDNPLRWHMPNHCQLPAYAGYAAGTSDGKQVLHDPDSLRSSTCTTASWGA